MEKILYWIGTNFTHYCIAKSLKEKIPNESYAIFDITSKPEKFFEKENIVNFQKKWFFHNHILNTKQMPDLEYLSKFEKKYDIQLSKIVFSERLFSEFNEFYKFQTNEILRILELECKFFERVLDEINPNFVLMFTPYLHQELLFFKLCKSKGIKTLELGNTRFDSAVIGFDDEIKKYDSFKVEGNVRNFQELRNYFSENYMLKSSNKIVKRTELSLNDKISMAMEYFIFTNDENIKNNFGYYGRNKVKVFLNYINNIVRMKKRKKFIDENFQNEIRDEKYILFPLQTEAESSLLIESPLQNDQIEVIKKISKAMPIDYKLIVKEHPMAKSRSWRSIESYKEMMEIPRVILLHPEIKVQEIMEKISLVITISSNVALDALFSEKPAMMFAENYISVIPSIYKVKNISDLPENIEKMLKENVNPIDLEKYIQFSEEISFRFNPLAFSQDISDFFHFSGQLVDVEITEEKMNEFFKKENDKIELLANQYIKKMSLEN